MKTMNYQEVLENLSPEELESIKKSADTLLKNLKKYVSICREDRFEKIDSKGGLRKRTD